jgi:hypothetical protein
MLSRTATGRLPPSSKVRIAHIVGEETGSERCSNYQNISEIETTSRRPNGQQETCYDFWLGIFQRGYSLQISSWFD